MDSKMSLFCRYCLLPKPCQRRGGRSLKSMRAILTQILLKSGPAGEVKIVYEDTKVVTGEDPELKWG